MDLKEIVGLGLTGIVIPWCAWVTANVYSQQKEMALMRQLLELMTKRSKHNMHN